MVEMKISCMQELRAIVDLFKLEVNEWLRKQISSHLVEGKDL